MSDRIRMSIFLAVVAVVTVLALLQGLAAEGTQRVLLLTLAALGVASLLMWTIGVRSKARRNS
jgi:predicted neutral ceramidase superfamily lipid hydrolase